MTDLTVPGPTQLFTVEPMPAETLVAIAANGLVTFYCRDLATATLTTAAIARSRLEPVRLTAADEPSN